MLLSTLLLTTMTMLLLWLICVEPFRVPFVFIITKPKLPLETIIFRFHFAEWLLLSTLASGLSLILAKLIERAKACARLCGYAATTKRGNEEKKITNSPIRPSIHPRVLDAPRSAVSPFCCASFARSVNVCACICCQYQIYKLNVVYSELWGFWTL